MFKSITLAMAAMLFAVGSVKADDLMKDLENMDLASISDASAEIEEFDLDGLDVDQLAENAGEETDAIEACFRRFGYRRCGWGGYRNYCGYRTYRTYRHCYNYGCGYGYSPYHCYRPIVHHCYSQCLPVITNYWGCY
jgi:hypothetical protein